MAEVPDIGDDATDDERYRTLRHFVAERRIPFYKVGTMLLFDQEQLDDWLESQRVEAVD